MRSRLPTGRSLALVLAVALLGAGASLAVGTRADVAAAEDSSSAPTGASGEGTEGTEPAPDDVAEEAPGGTGVTSIEVSDTGNVVKELGEPAGLTVAGSDRAFFEITVENVSVVRTCPSRGPVLAPANGYFVVVDLVASVRDDVADVVANGDDLFMPLAADAFRVVSPDGTVQAQPLTEASWGCFADDDLAPPFVGAGESVSGKVVLDSATDSGTLVYAPGGTGWEWAFG